MINKYPVWKNAIVILAIILGIVYAIPNLYKADYAIQVGKVNLSEKLNEAESKLVSDTVKTLEVKPKSVEKNTDLITLRYDTSDDQLKAKDQLSEKLGYDYSVTMNLAPTTPEILSKINAKPMSLGLDLRGGIHFLLELDIDAAIKKNMERRKKPLETLFRKKKIHRKRVEIGDSKIDILFRDKKNQEKAYDVLSSDNNYNELTISKPENPTDYRVTMSVNQAYIQDFTKNAMEKNLLQLRERVNQIGVAEPLVQRQGDKRIVVELPGIQDSKKARAILGSTSTLEFRMVDQTNNVNATDIARTGRVPHGSKLYFRKENSKGVKIPVILKEEIMLTGDKIEKAVAGFDQNSGTAAVHLKLNSEGGNIFYNATRNEIGNPMAVVYIENKAEKKKVDGKEVWTTREETEVINVATIQDALSTNFQITGLDSRGEAATLATLLKAGSLAAPIRFVEERTVGPTMGEENIKKGQLAITVGFLLVVVFMVVYYKSFGVIADVALFANLACMIAVLSLARATLTMPGIAGIVLTVGMAVDANVLIFERIREEIRNGLSPQAAINSGYDKAFWTIFDANLTTFIAAIILYMFGTGPIKGFAVTLSIGIATSMFTAIMGTRLIVNFVYGGKKLEKLSI